MEREKLVDLVNSNGGFHGRKLSYDCPYDELELEGILEYGRPEVFYQQEYSDQVVYYPDPKNRLHASHAPLDYTPIQRDLTTIRELGLSMRVIKRDPKERRLVTRRKNILEVLERLPERIRVVANKIKIDDLEKLSELSLSYNKPNVQRLVLVLVTQRANIADIYVSRNELSEHFGIKINGMGFLEELKASGLFEEQVTESVEVQANNILYNFRNKVTYSHL